MNAHIIDRALAADPYTFADDAPAELANVVLSLDEAERVKDQLASAASDGHDVGVRLQPDDDVNRVVALLPHIALVECHFPTFMDGRGYSHARLLRDKHGYQGALRAAGDVGRDQLHYLQQVGFNWFALREGEDADAALAGFDTFSVDYRDPVTRPKA